MRFKGVIEFEYELDAEEVAQIESLRGVGGDYPAEFYEDAETSLMYNDPNWFIRNRLQLAVDGEDHRLHFKSNVISRK